MAKATQVIEQVSKTVEVLEDTITGYTLNLTVEEAQVLRKILGNLNGDCKANSSVHRALGEAGVESDTEYRYAIFAGRFGVWTKGNAEDRQLETF